MFYSRDGKWGIYPKKITYKVEKQVYDLNEEMYKNNPEFSDVVIEDTVLTEQQLKRFELIRDATGVSLEDIRNHVLYGSDVEQLHKPIQEQKAKNRFERLIDWSTLTEEDMEDLLENYERWEPNQTYPQGKILRHGLQLYKVLTPGIHIAQAQYPPNIAKSVYASIGVPGTVKEYEQRDGSNPYMTGDVVIFKGRQYTCLKDYTSHSPEEYPDAWEVETKEEEIAEWVQKGYNTGAKVRFKGVAYENILVGKLNVWSPEGYPQGWKKI